MIQYLVHVSEFYTAIILAILTVKVLEAVNEYLAERSHGKKTHS